MAAGICPHCGYMADDEETDIQQTIPDTKPFEEDETGSAISPTMRLEENEEQKYEDPRWLQSGVILHGRYEVCKVIGAGGFGITYKVWDHKNTVYKALKEYFQQGVVNRIPGTTEVIVSAPKRREEFEYGKARLLNEAQIVAKFQSSTIVRVDDYFEENNTAYMVMEYLESQTLEDYIRNRKHVLDPEQAINIGVHICDALEEIHKAGVIHRDIAPDNIFVTDEGDVKIIDFGSARLSKEDIDDRMIMIKPGFAPPEQYEKIDPDNDRQQAWTDVYALGATLYMALTGQVPAESSDRKVDFDTDTDRVCYPKEINPNIPDFLNNTIMTAMAINIHERFQNAAEMKAALLQEKEVLPVEIVRKRKKMRRTAGIGCGFIAAILIVAIGVKVYWEKQKNVVLDPADITVWYSVSADTGLEQQENTVMETIREELLKSDEFSQITIELTAIPEDDYEKQLEDAYIEGNMPTIFECTDPDGSYMDGAADVKETLGEVEKGSCYFIDDYSKYFSQSDKIPMGFNIPVIYINTGLVPDYTNDMKISGMDDFMQLCNGEMIFKPIAVSEKVRGSYEQMFSDFTDYTDNMEGYSMDDFLSGAVVAYFSDTSDYYTVRDAVGRTGHLEIVPIGGKDIICQFSDYWSMSLCEGAEKIAAQKTLSYLLSNFSEDQHYLQTSMSGLPLEKKALSDYGDVHRAFKELLSDCSIYTFEKQ